jgi:hypothetical protein
VSCPLSHSDLFVFGRKRRESMFLLKRHTSQLDLSQSIDSPYLSTSRRERNVSFFLLNHLID